ncbi:MAG TPA: hypothetical protein VGL33_21320 [Streptosporangiaceae bacterium]
MNLSGSVALVTGANRGLGARLVAELLRAGRPRSTPPPVSPQRRSAMTDGCSR